MYYIANYIEFLHMQFLRKCVNFEFRDIPTKQTVKYIASSLKWYVVSAYVSNGCNVMHC